MKYRVIYKDNPVEGRFHKYNIVLEGNLMNYMFDTENLCVEDWPKALRFTLAQRYYIINVEEIADIVDVNELYFRYENKRRYIMSGLVKDSNLIEKVTGESESYSDESLYNITSFGTDLTFRELHFMYKEGDLAKPELQRKYVWSKNEASRFIDSILLGLPVPSIFLAKTKDNKRLIVDGYQRIMTVYDYIEGVFSSDGKPFKLSNAENINSKWRGKAYSELTEDQRRMIRTSSIHAIVFEQKHPQDDTGMYQIFERINTSGRALKPQEIRNCVYQGEFNQFLFDLNKEVVWRTVLAQPEEDARMSDVELILRFFAFAELENREEAGQNQIILAKYLNAFMSAKVNISEEEKEIYGKMFLETITYLLNNVGEKIFRNGKIKEDAFIWAKKVNPVIFDAVCTATIKTKQTLGDYPQVDNLYDRYELLLRDEEFQRVIKQRTTDMKNIKERVAIACRKLYGIEL